MCRLSRCRLGTRGVRRPPLAILAAAWLALAAPIASAAGEATPTRGRQRPKAVTKSCAGEGCHVAITDHKVKHGPVAQGKCTACHQYDEPKLHQFKLADDKNALCKLCHTLKQRTVVHKPVKQGRCQGCHDPHGSDHRYMLVSDPTLGLCVGCHKQEGFVKKKFKHGPVAAGACILCHESHSSLEPKLLVKKPQKLCVTCHTEISGGAEGKHRHAHAPVKEGDCAACHDPHASDYEYQLRQDTPDLCFSCHEPVKKQLAKSETVHGVVLQPGGCLACHAPHDSALPRLQRASQTTLCLSCHDKPIETEQERTLTDMASLLKDNPQHHGPIREDSCSACHLPHAGNRHNMLVKAYPPEFYAAFSIERYELCFECHRPELVKDKRGRGLTRFRKGDLNLHWLHVNREKGRTCRACHEVHASRNPFHMRDAVPFGDRGWMLEIRYEKSDTGGSCSPGCHETQTYDHGQAGGAIEKRSGAPDRVNASQKGASR